MSSLQKGTIIPTTKDAVLLLGSTILPHAVPEENDVIVIEGKTFKVTNVDRDPDGASYICQVR